MSDTAYETAHVAVLDQLRDAFADVIEEAHWVSEEVHRPEDLGGLADQLLQAGNIVIPSSGTPSFALPAPADLSEMLEDVVDDDLLRLVRVHPGERVHVDDSIFKANQRKPQGAFQGLRAGDTKISGSDAFPGSHELRDEVLRSSLQTTEPLKRASWFRLRVSS